MFILRLGAVFAIVYLTLSAAEKRAVGTAEGDGVDGSRLKDNGKRDTRSHARVIQDRRDAHANNLRQEDLLPSPDGAAENIGEVLRQVLEGDDEQKLLVIQKELAKNHRKALRKRDHCWGGGHDCWWK